jgi:hypothetical protein
MTATASGADELAGTLLDNLTAGLDFSVPDIDLDLPIFGQPPETGPLYEPITPIAISDLTTGAVGGSGVFDRLMVSLVKHLQVEYEANRISGAEYTKAYVGVIAAALQTSSQFLLAKDQAYWQNILVQSQAQAAQLEVTKSRIAIETAKMDLAKSRTDAETAEVNYGLIKMKIATEDATYANLAKQGEGLDFTNSNILPKQEVLLAEQVEVQRSQTSDTRTDGTTSIAGAVGKQKALYDQQITSYKRDAETKAVKLYTDAWITQKTIDEGLLAPEQFKNAQVDEVLGILRTNLALDVTE